MGRERSPKAARRQAGGQRGRCGLSSFGEEIKGFALASRTCRRDGAVRKSNGRNPEGKVWARGRSVGRDLRQSAQISFAQKPLRLQPWRLLAFFGCRSRQSRAW